MLNIHLSKCLDRIAEQTGWGSYEKWIHPQFVELSNQIFQKCGVIISVTSLKRIFGKIKSDHEPQKETRNTLARFVGYADWDDFVKHTPIAFQVKATKMYDKSGKSRNMLLLFGSFFIVFLPVIIFMVYRDKPVDFSSVYFEGKYLTGSSPHTVVFDYDIRSVSDSVFIDFDDSFSDTRREYLLPEHKTITHHYLLPDLYRVSMVNKYKAIRTTHVNLYTNGWQCFFGYNNRKNFFPIDTEKGDFLLSVCPDSIFKTGFVRKDEDIIIKYRLVNDFGVSGDHFSMKATVKDSRKFGTMHCFFASFIIHGDSGKVSVSFTSEDCIHKAWIRYGDVKLEGKYHDLSALAADFNQLQNLEISVFDQRLNVKIGDSLRYSQPIGLKIGSIRALLFDTTPSGVLKTFELTDFSSQTRF